MSSPDVIVVDGGPPQVIEVQLFTGPPGPQGPPGPASTALEYQFKTATTSPPATGEVRCNNANQQLATALYLAGTTAAGNDARNMLRLLAAGNKIVIQDQADATKAQRYLVTAASVDNGTWFQIPVTWEATGGAPLTDQVGNQRTIVGLLYPGPAGPQGPPGPSGDLSTVPLLAPADDTRNLYSGPGGRLILAAKVTGDANNRITFDTNGNLQWGDGTAAPDTTLVRLGPASLQLGVGNFGNFYTGGEIRANVNHASARVVIGPGGPSAEPGLVIGTSNDLRLYRFAAGVLAVGTTTQAGTLRIYGTSGGSRSVQTHVTTETNPRWYVSADGTMSWGPGSAAEDITLWRPGAVGALLIQGIGPATQTRLFIRAVAGQTGDLQIWQDSVPNTIVKLTAQGVFQFGSAADASLARIGDATHQGLTIASTRTLAAGANDNAVLQITPTVNGAFTLTRLAYIEAKQPAGSSTITDAALASFDAAAGTHKAVDAGTTKTTPATVNAWVKVNINGTIHYLPAYTSKTT